MSSSTVGNPIAGYDQLEAIQYVGVKVWNSGTLTWDKWSGGGGGGGGAVTIADGADVAEGATTDAAVTTDVAGTVSGKLRGLVKILGSVWDSVNSRLKVDGSGVTQPVSGSLGRTWTLSSGTDTVAAACVQSGTWNQNLTQYNSVAVGATNAIHVQPGTGASFTVTNTNLDVALSTRLKPADTLTGVTTVGAVTSITNALPAGTNRIGSVRPVDSADADLTAAKLTQTSRFLGVQSSVDAGRTNLQFYAVAAAAGATGTETAITLTKSSDTSATTTGTSFIITNGKRWRITAISFATRGHATATIQTTTFNLRINTAGAVTTTSTPIVLAVRSATPATASAWDRVIVPIGNGIEFTGNGTIQFGVTAAATYVTNAPTWDVLITGFEY